MSIKNIDYLTFDIYLKKEMINDINFNEKESIEKYLKKLFKILKDKYNITIEGFYNISIYIDKYYGVILHLEKEDLEYYSFYKNQVDMKIRTYECSFLYQIDDIPYNLLDKIKIHFNNNNVFLEIKEELSNLEMMNLLENSIIFYDENKLY